MTMIQPKNNEPLEITIRRFKRLCEKSGIITLARLKARFQSNTEKKKLDAANSKKRLRKAMGRPPEPLRAKKIRNKKR